MRPPRVLLLLALPVVGCTPSGPPPDDDIDGIVAEAMDFQKIPAVSVLVMDGEKVLKHRAYGKTSLDPPVAATTSTVFPVFAITKTFTAVGVLKLAEQGKLALDDPLGEVLPDPPEAWRGITLRQLLSHTSGLPDLLETSPRRVYLSGDREDALKGAAARPLVAEPGKVGADNQTGYVLLGKVVEEVTGRPFARYMTEEFFRPLGMASTTYGNRRGEVAGRAPYFRTVRLDRIDAIWKATPLDAATPDDIPDDPPYQDAGATLNTSTEDLVKWEAALASGGLLKPESLAAMWHPEPATFRTMRGRRAGMGLGWYVTDVPGHRTAFLEGGMSSSYNRMLDDHLTVIVLTNCRGADLDRIVKRISTYYIPKGL